MRFENPELKNSNNTVVCFLPTFCLKAPGRELVKSSSETECRLDENLWNRSKV